MSDSVAVSAKMFVAAGQTVRSSRAIAPAAGEEAKLSFEDVRALAKIREEPKSDSKWPGQACDGENAAECVAEPPDPSQPAKAAEGGPTDTSVCPDDGQGGTVEGQGQVAQDEAHADPVSTVASEQMQVASGESKGIQEEVNPASSEQGRIVAQADSGQSQNADQPQTISSNDLTQDSFPSTPTQAIGQEGENASGIVKEATIQDGKANSMLEREGASAEANKASESSQVATETKSENVVLQDRVPVAEVSDAKTDTPKSAGPAQAAEANASSKAESFSVEKQSDNSTAKAGVEANATAETGAKAERDTDPLRQDSHVASDQAGSVKSSPESQTGTASGESKNGQLLNSNENPKEQMEVSIATGSDSTSFSQRVSAQQEAGATNSDLATPKGASQSVSDQILDSVRASLAGGEKQVTVRLNPPELGAVTVRFQEQGEQIRAVLEVSRSDTRQEVERAMPDVLRTLQESGVQIRRVEVVLSDQSGNKDLTKESFQQQDAWAQEETSQQQPGNRRGSAPSAWRGSTQAVQGSPGLQDADAQDVLVTGRINMLM